MEIGISGPEDILWMQRKAGCANLAQKRRWFGQMCKRCAVAFPHKKERQILRFDVQYLVHLQGLEPWAHWLRETNVQQSSIFRITQIRCFYRFIVNLRFASAAFFAPVIPSCIRYPAIPVCKKCAKMCRAKISPLKQVSDFYAKPGKRSGSSPIRQLRSCLFRPSIKCTSTTMIHGRELRTQKFIRCSFLCIRWTFFSSVSF